MSPRKSLRFRRFGKTYHLQLDDAGDLTNVLDLDKGHWVATSAPISTFRGDPKLLRLVDSDQNGRIRASEMKDAIAWLLDVLRDTSGVHRHSDVVKLDTINTDNEQGRRIRESAGRILVSAGHVDAPDISLALVRQTLSRAEVTPVSEAGVVLAEAAEDQNIRQFIADVVGVVMPATHPSGKPGLGKAQLDLFMSQATAYLNWNARGQPTDPADAARLYPLGDQTADAFAALQAVSNRLDQYFAQCEAVAFDERYVQQLPPGSGAVAQTDFNDPSAILGLISQAPLANPMPEGKLNFSEPVNPTDRANLNQFKDRVLAPILGATNDGLTKRQWQSVKQRFYIYENWVNAKPKDAVATLGLEKLRTYRDGGFVGRVQVLIDGSRETALQMDDIRLVEKLLLFQAHLLNLANNFVSFPHLYDPKQRAIFETGALFMDGRRFDMAIKVENRAEHAKVAANSNMFVLYVHLDRHDAPSPSEMAVPVTAGGKGNLMVGKRGIFIDVDGREWDARVLQIIENPISVREAMVAPFKRIGALVSGKIEKMTGTAEKQLDTAAQSAMAPGTPASPPPAAATTNRGLAAGGLLAGGGLALAAVSSAIVYIGNIVADRPFVLVGGLAGALMAVLLPTVIQAYLKLRRRDLSAILEGSGWAINARMRLTHGQSRNFTRKPRFPLGSRGIAVWRSRLIWIGVLIALASGTAYWFHIEKTKSSETANAEQAESTAPNATIETIIDSPVEADQSRSIEQAAKEAGNAQ